MSTVAQRLITTDEFRRLPEPSDGSIQELVHGEVVTTPPPGFRHGNCQSNADFLLKSFVRPRRLGRVTVETGLVTERDPDTVRGPDVAYWSAESLPLDLEPTGYPDVAADLCVEVLSPSDTAREMLAKVLEYFTRGVKMVWVIDPERRTVTVYHPTQQPRILRENDTLTGEEVLPGFECPVAEFFA